MLWYDVMIWNGVLWWCLVTRCDKIWYVMIKVEGFQNYTGQGVPQDGRRGGRGARKKQNLHQRVRKKKGGGKGKENSCRRLSNIVEYCGMLWNLLECWGILVACCGILSASPGAVGTSWRVRGARARALARGESKTLMGTSMFIESGHSK